VLWNVALNKAFFIGDGLPETVPGQWLVLWTLEKSGTPVNKGGFTVREDHLGIASSQKLNPGAAIQGFALSLESSPSVTAPTKVVMLPGTSVEVPSAPPRR
jgi:hypothetical protein